MEETNKLVEKQPLLQGDVTRSNITVGAKVINSDGEIGTIKEYDEELHNVFVEYDNGGSGFSCLNKECIEEVEVNGQKIEVSQFTPLYYFG